MPRKGYTEAQIVFPLKLEENEGTARDVCRKLGITEQTFYRWKRQYEGLGVSELRDLRLLREESG